MKTVVIASPVRQKPEILKEFLWSLEQLDRPELDLRFVFVDDNDAPCQILKAFAQKHQPAVKIIRGSANSDYRRDEHTHCWQEDLIWKVAAYKDALMAYAKTTDCDYIFLVDSDLVLQPKTLAHLAGLKLDIVSEVYWTKWEPDLGPLPQVWQKGQYELFYRKPGEKLTPEEADSRSRHFLNMLLVPGTYKVGGLGACTLISRKALEGGISFKEIYNLDLLGEDRHFCVRAAALGFELFADTHYPPFHIYRESELPAVHKFKLKYFPSYQPPKPRLTLAMLVKNEAGRYLEKVLRHAAQYIDSAVILDDASTDNTVEICEKCLDGIEHTIISNTVSHFSNEILLRKQLWDAAGQHRPDWLLILDADEMFEDGICGQISAMLTNPHVEAYSFRLYDMWDDNHYREDACWQAHFYYRPFIVRYNAKSKWEWLEIPQHCGRFPQNITTLRTVNSPIRLKHLGWIKPADRVAKYLRYKRLDPNCRYGIKEQYLSILDPKPNLIEWRE